MLDYMLEGFNHMIDSTSSTPGNIWKHECAKVPVVSKGDENPSSETSSAPPSSTPGDARSDVITSTIQTWKAVAQGGL